MLRTIQARKNCPVGRNLGQIQTLESAHLLVTNWGEKEIQKSLDNIPCRSADVIPLHLTLDDDDDFDLPTPCCCRPPAPSASFQVQLLLPERSRVFSKRPLGRHVPLRRKKVEAAERVNFVCGPKLGLLVPC